MLEVLDGSSKECTAVEVKLLYQKVQLHHWMIRMMKIK